MKWGKNRGYLFESFFLEGFFLFLKLFLTLPEVVILKYFWSRRMHPVMGKTIRERILNNKKLIFNPDEIEVLKHVVRIYNLISWIIEGRDNSEDRDKKYYEDIKLINSELESEIGVFTKKFEGRVYKWMEKVENTSNENWKYEYYVMVTFASDINTWELESNEMYCLIEWMEESGLIDWCSSVVGKDVFDFDCSGYDIEDYDLMIEEKRLNIVKTIEKVNKMRGI